MKPCYTVYFLALVLLFLSCEKKTGEKEQTWSVASLRDHPQAVKWLDHYGLSPDDFRDTISATHPELLSADWHNPAEMMEIYGDLFIYSPDSTMIIDLHSYSTVFEKTDDNSLIYLGSEPDIEVALVHLTDTSRLRILFCGPACVPEEAAWTRDSVIHVFGHADPDGQGYIPVIWSFDLKSGLLLHFQNSLVRKNEPLDYVEKVRMKAFIPHR